MTEVLKSPQTSTDAEPRSEGWSEVEDALHSLTTEQPNPTEQTEASLADEAYHPDERNPSRFGAMFISAANRINKRLEQRAINKAHREALVEDSERTVELQNDAYGTYLSNIDYSSDHEEALGMNERFDAKAARQEKIDQTKSKLRAIGRSTLDRLKDAGLISLGMTIAGASKSKELAGKASQQAKQSVSTGMNRAEELAGKAGQKMEGAIESGINAVSGTIESAKEAMDHRRQAATVRKEQALNRKYERHAKVMKRRRAIGSFILRSRATGQSALDTWNNYPNK